MEIVLLLLKWYLIGYIVCVAVLLIDKKLHNTYYTVRDFIRDLTGGCLLSWIAAGALLWLNCDRVIGQWWEKNKNKKLF